MRRTPALILLLALLSCEAPSLDTAVITRVGEDWRVTYELAEPASSLCFARPGGFYRERVWTIDTPGWRFEREGEEQRLVGEGPATRIELSFPVFTEHLPKEYELFREFTDGSVALYTGHLYVAPDVATCADAEAFVERVALVPDADENIVVQGRVHKGPTTWEDPGNGGTYVYFGRIEPLEREAITAIVDPGAPGWLVETMHARLPELFSHYAERFGEELPWKPFVLFDFIDSNRPGLSSGGGTLTGLVQLSSEGEGWHEQEAITTELMLNLLAHESVHLWNGQLHRGEPSSDAWMHEGSADAFANLMLRRMGAVDDERLAERRSLALNGCARELRLGALDQAASRGRYDAYYDCGEMIALASVAALGDPGDDERLFDIWRRLFEAGERYTREDYFESVGALGGSADFVAELKRFIGAEHDDPATALIDLFDTVGVALEISDRLPVEMRSRVAREALRDVMAANCDGVYGLGQGRGSLVTDAIAGCAPFESGMEIVEIAGLPVARDGDRIDRLIGECLAGEPLELTLAGGESVRVPCAEELPEATRPLRFPVLLKP